MVEQQTIGQFLQALSSKEAVPGGGGCAALAGALGNALGQMVIRLTVGKKRYADVEQELYGLLEQLEALQKELVFLADEDERVFAPLAKAYGLPASTEEEKQYKDQVMEEKLLAASRVPLEVMEKSTAVLEILEQLRQKGSKMVISDVAVGAQMARAALLSGWMNVLINTGSMKRRRQALEINNRAARLSQTGSGLADKIYQQILVQLSKQEER